MEENTKKSLKTIILMVLLSVFMLYNGYMLGASSSFQKICKYNFGNYTTIPTHVDDLTIHQCSINNTAFRIMLSTTR